MAQAVLLPGALPLASPSRQGTPSGTRSSCTYTPFFGHQLFAKSSAVSKRQCRPGSARASAVKEVLSDSHHEKKHHGHHNHDHRKPGESELEEWLHEQGLPPCKVVLKDKKLHGHERPIHVLVASEDLEAGEVALEVPDSLVVTLERVLGDETIAELLTTNKLSELACLALYLMYEKKRGKESFWYPFIKELDRQRGRGQLAVESPLLWSNQEISEYLAGSPMQNIVKERLIGIQREYQELDTVWFMAGSLFQEYPFDIPTEAFPFHIFKGAFAAVQASVVHLQGVNLARRFALVPLGPPLMSYGSNCRAMLKAVNGTVQLTTDRPYKAGEPITAWCGPQPNTKLLLNYGFVDEDNPYDRLVVEAALDPEDPFYQKKRAIVQKNDKLTKQTFQIYKDKEEEAVLNMLPYMRLAHVTDPEEMDSVIFAQGPVCPVSPCNEQAVLQQMRKYFTSRLGKYKTTIEEDAQVIEDKNANPKKRVASKLLRAEKRILHNTVAVIDDILGLLPEGSTSPCSGFYPPKLT